MTIARAQTASAVGSIPDSDADLEARQAERQARDEQHIDNLRIKAARQRRDLEDTERALAAAIAALGD